MGMGEISGIGKLKDSIIGNKAEIKPGEYEIIGYTQTGGSHSDIYKEVEKPIEGLVVNEVYEGDYFYNVAVLNEQNQQIFLAVPNDCLKSDKTKKMGTPEEYRD